MGKSTVQININKKEDKKDLINKAADTWARLCIAYIKQTHYCEAQDSANKNYEIKK